ncbi:uroporphyrinogen decarboxylase|uniref:Uroporphyrinogen decarboxylase n=2 Tax=Dendrosporobacter quercicolus TaxID=146817 RepID=A0A1G9S5G5_9FIRM|nr:uroporphyrinogen decarboxylase [Dendrosporobacter quercicolus DSM 1736]SDM30530.1 uroporphyrinogen decarboxylase [Dendrosporobacter quercicolus]
MKAKEIILRAIKGSGRPPSRPAAALLSGATWTFRQRNLTLKEALDQPELAAGIICEINRTVKSDIVWPGSGFHNLLVHIFGGKIKFRPQGNIDVDEPAFGSISDLDHVDLARIDAHEWIVHIRSIIGAVSQRIGSDYLIGTSCWGPFTLAGQFYGVERLMSGLYKDKQGIRALMEVMTEVCFRYLAPAVERGAAMLSIAEPTASGDLISLKHFEEFVAPYLQKVITRLKEQDAFITLHICGNIGDRLYLAPQLGVDLLSVDYKVDLAQARRVLQGKIALAGNVNPVLLKDGSAAQVRAAALKCLEAAYDDRFVLMPGCDIPPAVPLENVVAFINCGAGRPF